jgi:biotin carboxyl carrier protein
MKTVSVTLGGKTISVLVHTDGRIEVAGRPGFFSVVQTSPYEYLVEDQEGKQLLVAALSTGHAVLLQSDGHLLDGRIESERDILLRKFQPTETGGEGQRELHAPMPSLVIAVEVSAGQRVIAGQGLVILEAMKMENELRATHEGTVKSIYVKPGNPVEKGELLLDFES